MAGPCFSDAPSTGFPDKCCGIVVDEMSGIHMAHQVEEGGNPQITIKAGDRPGEALG